MAAQLDQGTSRVGGSFRANYETSLGSLIKRRGGIGNVLKTLGIAKVEQDVHVSSSSVRSREVERHKRGCATKARRRGRENTFRS